MNLIRSPKQTVWKMIQKISGKNQSTPLKHLIKNNTQVTNIKDISPTHRLRPQQIPLPQTPTQFHKYKDKKQKQKLNFKSGNTESYNGIFSLSELKEAIQKSHNTAIGPDEIHYEFLRQLPPKSLEYLLAALNDIWKNSILPES